MNIPAFCWRNEMLLWCDFLFYFVLYFFSARYLVLFMDSCMTFNYTLLKEQDQYLFNF